MKSTSPSRFSLCARAATLLAMLPMTAGADFKGSDSFKWTAPHWYLYYQEGSILDIYNSRLEYVSDRPSECNLLWLPNRGSYRKDWYVQVDIHMEILEQPKEGIIAAGINLINSADNSGIERCTVLMTRSQIDGYPVNAIAMTTYLGKPFLLESTARDATLRAHFDSNAKTLTASWNTGSGWRYAPSVNIVNWGMNNTDEFTAAVLGANFSAPDSGLFVFSGEVYLKNFKTGAATPEITIEQPAKKMLTDGKSKTSFGSASVGFGKVTKSFIIRNDGTTALRNIRLTHAGANPADFSFTSPGKSDLLPGASTTFKVTFKPKVAGTRRSIIRVRSNDTDEAAFDLPVTGTGVK